MEVVLVSSLFLWAVGFSTFIQSRMACLSENGSGLKKRKGVGMQIRCARMKYMSQLSSLDGPIQEIQLWHFNFRTQLVFI